MNKYKEIKRIAVILFAGVLGVLFLLWQLNYNTDKVKISMLDYDNTYQSKTEVVDGKANINTATALTLSKLQGIGEKMAECIVDYRSEHGEFKNIAEIKNVPGIGDKTFENIKDYICVE